MGIRRNGKALQPSWAWRPCAVRRPDESRHTGLRRPKEEAQVIELVEREGIEPSTPAL